MLAMWSSGVNWFLGFVQAKASWVLGIWAMLSLAGALLSPGISVDTSLDALLPAQSRAVEAIESVRQRVPSTSPLYLLVASSQPALNRELAQTLVERARLWPETLNAMAQRDPSYFTDRQLLFLPTERLEQLADDAEALVDFRVCEQLPGCFSLEDEPTLPSEQDLQGELSELPNVQALLSLLGLEAVPSRDNPSTEDQKSKETTPEQGRKRPGELCSPDGLVCTVQVIVNGSPTDFAFAEHIFEQANELFDQVRPIDAPSDLKLETSGSYRNVVITKKAVGGDLSWTAFVSLGLVALILAAQFRGLRSLLLLFLPLLFAGLTTVGAIALAHPTLNLMSAFTMAVLAGLGIDFGVHLLTHYGEERKTIEDPIEALRATFHGLRGPMLVAGVTTTSAFGALAAAKFRGFAEMGVLAAAGIALSFLAYFTVFPALVVLLHRWRPETHSCIRQLRLPRLTMRNPQALARWIVLTGTALGLCAAAVASQISFEYDFRNLQPSRVGHGIHWGSSMHGTTRPAVVLLANSPEQLNAAAAQLRRQPDPRLRNKPDRPWLITPEAFLPSDQPEKLVQLRRLESSVQRGISKTSGQEQAELKQWLPYLQHHSPIAAETLPAWVQGWLSERDGSFGKYGLAYMSLRGSDAREMEVLSSVLDEWSLALPDITFASASALLGIVVPGLRRDAPLMIGLALAGLCIGALAIGRSARRVAVVLAPLSLAMALAMAVAVLTGMRVNLYNLVVFPLAFGIGVDGAVYVVWALCNGPQDERWKQFRVTARGVLGSTLTTTAGFGSLYIASNPGLSSLGGLAVVTFLATLVANLLWLPALVWMLQQRKLL